jgi:acetoin:2,6-dichlorophenolindophenol oxidoreductase subunit beta
MSFASLPKLLNSLTRGTKMPRNISFAEAIREALHEEMEKNQDILYYGIDVAQNVTGLTRGLAAKFGRERVVDTPIAESLIVGLGIGSAIMGVRAVSEIMYEDFAMLAMDHLYNNMGSWHYITNGQYCVPLTVITISGSGTAMGAGHGHGQALQPVFMSAPGISICVPSNPYDAKGLLKTALRTNHPVIYSVDRVLLREGGTPGAIPQTEVPEGEYTLPFGLAKVVRSGRDVTITAAGKMVRHAQYSAIELAKAGIDVEIIDLRTIAPLDEGAILKSVAKTGKLVVAEESRMIGGLGSEILATIASADPSLLKAPAKRVAAPMIPIPAAAVLEGLYLPNQDDITKSVRELCK